MKVLKLICPFDERWMQAIFNYKRTAYDEI
jgi:hypothetical protein